MTTSIQGATLPYRSGVIGGRATFADLLRSEWTKFRTVRGWLIGTAVAALLTVLVGLIASLGGNTSCAGADAGGGGGAMAQDPCVAGSPPTGPGGEVVSDTFHFVHRSLSGDGSITARVTSLTGLTPSDEPPADDQPDNPGGQAGGDPLAGMQSGVQPWAKAGVIIKDGTAQGSAYAAMLVTGSNGVRMQGNYVNDVAGAPGTVSADAPRWLRLIRTGTVVIGEESSDGTSWSQVGSMDLTGLPATVQVGMFVASPDFEQTDQNFGGADTFGGPTQATAAFDQLEVTVSGSESSGGQSGNDRSSAGWTDDSIGSLPIPAADFAYGDGVFTISGSGDIAPAVAGPGGGTVERGLVGVFLGLIAVIIVGTLFITAEYRRGLVRTSLSASPTRWRLLAAKALVLGGVMFLSGLLTGAVGVWVLGWLRRSTGESMFPVGWLTELRVVGGTGALFAVVAVLALAVGTILRRSTGAVATVIVLVVLPYILAVASVLQAGPADWLLRLTPAAGFAITQSMLEYPQVQAAYIPPLGYFPLSPLAGFGVLCLWTAIALGLAGVSLHRRDA